MGNCTVQSCDLIRTENDAEKPSARDMHLILGVLRRRDLRAHTIQSCDLIRTENDAEKQSARDMHLILGDLRLRDLRAHESSL